MTPPRRLDRLTISRQQSAEAISRSEHLIGLDRGCDDPSHPFAPRARLRWSGSSRAAIASFSAASGRLTSMPRSPDRGRHHPDAEIFKFVRHPATGARQQRDRALPRRPACASAASSTISSPWASRSRATIFDPSQHSDGLNGAACRSSSTPIISDLYLRRAALVLLVGASISFASRGLVSPERQPPHSACHHGRRTQIARTSWFALRRKRRASRRRRLQHRFEPSPLLQSGLMMG